MTWSYKTPWDGRAFELIEREGHYAPYIAWREWMDRKSEFDVDLITSVSDRILLMDAMNKAIEEAVKHAIEELESNVPKHDQSTEGI